MQGSSDIGTLAGRIMLATIFVLSGLNKVMKPAMTMFYMAQTGMGRLVYPGLIVSILVELGCGLLLMVGYRARVAALIIFLWFIPVTIIFHVIPYYQAAAAGQPMVATQQQINYMKNLSIMGGLLMIAGMGPGAISFDGRRTSTGSEATQRAA